MIEAALVYYPVHGTHIPFSTSKVNHYHLVSISVVPIKNALSHVGLRKSDSLLIKFLQLQGPITQATPRLTSKAGRRPAVILVSNYLQNKI